MILSGRRLAALASILLLAACTDMGEAEEGAPGGEASADSAAMLPMNLAELADRWTGDLDGMVERRTIRVLTVHGDGFYYLDGASQRGVTYELAREFERWINRRHGSRSRPVNVVVFPVTLDRLLPLLEAGYGDIAAAGLTITDDRAERVAFSDPIVRDVHEILVTGPAAPPIEDLGGLAGRELLLRPGSSYDESVSRLSDSLRAAGREAVDVGYVNPRLDDETLLRIVAAGGLPWVVVDDFKASFWAGVLSQLEPRDDLVLREGGQLAWALRRGSPELLAAVNEFVRGHRQGTLIGNVLLQRYLQHDGWITGALPGNRDPAFQRVSDLFREYGRRYGFDWRALTAQAYQESRLRQELRSDRGAVGIMQVLPTTAADLGISDVTELENNVHAGTAYMAHLRDTYFAEPALDSLNRYLFTLAAYNAGPNRLQRLRERSREAGLDPDVWFGNVELTAARSVGRETVQYVAEVTRRYLAYRLVDEQWERGTNGADGVGATPAAAR